MNHIISVSLKDWDLTSKEVTTDERNDEGPRMDNLPTTIEYCLVPAFCERTGHTKGAVYKKIHDGVWVEGKHYRKAPDGRIHINLKEYQAWVEGMPVVA